MKALVSFKQKLEKRLEELEVEKEEVSDTLETVNSILLEKGFKRGDIKDAAQTQKPEVTEVEEKHDFIQGSDGVLLITDSTIENCEKSKYFTELIERSSLVPGLLDPLYAAQQ